MSTLSFSESLKTAIQIAQSFAREYYCEKFSLPHLLRGLLHKEVGLVEFLKSLDKDTAYMIDWAEIRMEDFPRTTKLPDTMTADDKVVTVFEEADNVRLKLGLDDITPVCILVALVKPNIGFSAEQLKSFPLKEKEILDLYVNDAAVTNAIVGSGKEGSAASGSAPKSANALLKFCIDRTSLAKEGKIDPIIGRDKEMRMMLEILGRRTKPNVIIIGEPGVGKTALVDGFALNLAEGKVPDNLKESVLFELDLGALVAGASYKGEVEDRLKNIIKEIKQFDKAVLFIDEIHILLDPKGSMGGGAANLLKPELARGEITVIGATTLDEYRKIIEPEQAFNRRFETLKVDEPNLDTATKMLEKVISAYEKHHNLEVNDGVLPECVRFAKRYIKDRRLPDAAIDLLDRTMAAIRMMNETSEMELVGLQAEFDAIRSNETYNESDRIALLKWLNTLITNRLSPVLLGQLENTADPSKMESALELEGYLEKILSTLHTLSKNVNSKVSKQDVAAVISYKTGIPLGKIQSQEQQKLLQMEDILKRRVVGQDLAVKALSDAVVESRSGLNKPGQPIGSFFLLGPTGTGKTEVTKSIADFLFNDEKAMIRFDMSEFKEEHSAALLYGAPPGYVGYEEGGMLVNKIRQQPYSVVLFDEIEKAHPSVFDIFLQILDEGKMHDRLGKEGDFSNSLIIFTSNIGSEWIVEQFNQDVIPKSSELMEIMTRYFRPEFLARLTEIVPFAPISEKNVVKILEIQMKSLLESLEKLSITLDISEEAKKRIALTGFTPKYGARQISGVIRTHLRRPISKLIVSGKATKGSKIVVALNDSDEIVWDVK